MPSFLPTLSNPHTYGPSSNGRSNTHGKSSKTFYSSTPVPPPLSAGKIRKRSNASASSTACSMSSASRLLQYIVLPCLSVVLIGFQFYIFVLPYFWNQGEYTSDPFLLSPTTKERLATSHRQVMDYLEQGKLRNPEDRGRQPKMATLLNVSGRNKNNKTALEQLHKFPYKHREFPGTKIVYLLHIHKSAGTTLCQLAHYNHLSASPNNCNVQRDQRCCGKGDSLEAQQLYYEHAGADFVASEGRMYQAMDLEHYRYIVVFRKSQERYFSHWKHTRRVYLQLPAYQEDPEKPAAGGIRDHDGVPIVHNHGDRIDRMLDLVRENKQDRKARRDAKMRQMEEWQRQAAQEFQVNLTPQKERAIHAPPPPKPKEEMGVEDFAVANNNQFFFPHRRRLEASRNDNNLSSLKGYSNNPPEHDKEDNNNNGNGGLINILKGKGEKAILKGKGGKATTPKPKRRHDRPVLVAHPAEDPTLSQFSKPLVGDRFSDWWAAQPDNWNFRQLCGTHCTGIPKYQLSMQDWAYTLERMLQFETVLFLEPDLQPSVTVLAHRLNWKLSSLTTLQQLSEQDDQETAIKKEAARRKKKNGIESSSESLQLWYQEEKAKQQRQKQYMKEDRADPITKGQKDDWDPLMSALDDALYDIAQRWERLKLETGKTSLTPQELLPLVDIASLSDEAIEGAFQWYMEEAPGNHRTQCHNECCAVQCSAW